MSSTESDASMLHQSITDRITPNPEMELTAVRSIEYGALSTGSGRTGPRQRHSDTMGTSSTTSDHRQRRYDAAGTRALGRRAHPNTCSTRFGTLKNVSSWALSCQCGPTTIDRGLDQL